MAKKEPEKKKRVVFSLRAKPGSVVLVAGTFNDWDTTSKNVKKMIDTTGDGDFSKALVLSRGHHEYKFMVDGEWVADDKANWVHNAHGTLNSLIEV